MVVEVMAGRWGEAIADQRLRALCRFADRLTRFPGLCLESDLAALRDVDLDDRAIHDLVLVVGYFNFVNRIALGLAVQLEAPDAAPLG